MTEKTRRNRRADGVAVRSFVRLVLALILAISPWPDLPRLISEWRPPDPSVQVDPGQCLRDLAALPLEANPVPDRRTAEGFGGTNAVRVTEGRWEEGRGGNEGVRR